MDLSSALLDLALEQFGGRWHGGPIPRCGLRDSAKATEDTGPGAHLPCSKHAQRGGYATSRRNQKLPTERKGRESQGLPQLATSRPLTLYIRSVLAGPRKDRRR